MQDQQISLWPEVQYTYRPLDELFAESLPGIRIEEIYGKCSHEDDHQYVRALAVSHYYNIH